MNRFKIKTAILATGFTPMFHFSMATGLSLMRSDPLFSEVSGTMLQMLVTVPSLVSIPVSLLLDKMSAVISHKKLAIAALLLMAVGGTAPYFLRSFAAIMAMRVLVGISIGITIPLSPSLVVGFFEGFERSRMIGFSQASLSLGGVLSAYGAGLLANVGWRESFLVYLLAIPALVLVVLFLPDRPAEDAGRETGRLRALNLSVLKYCLVVVLFMTAANTFSTNISLLLGNEGIGKASDAGTALSFLTFGAFALGLVFGYFSKLTKRFTLSSSALFGAVGLAVIALAQSVPVVFLGSFVLGTGIVTVTAEASVLLAAAVPPEAGTLAVSMGMASMNFGQFISPTVITPLSKLLSDGSERSRYWLAGGLCAVLTAFLLIRALLPSRERRSIG